MSENKRTRRVAIPPMAARFVEKHSVPTGRNSMQLLPEYQDEFLALIELERACKGLWRAQDRHGNAIGPVEQERARKSVERAERRHRKAVAALKEAHRAREEKVYPPLRAV